MKESHVGRGGYRSRGGQASQNRQDLQMSRVLSFQVILLSHFLQT